MADATFDGDNLLILLPAAQTTVDVQTELYSAWKDFVRLDPANRRFPPAFTTEGGTDTVPGEVSGRNFFLRNDLGWRIRPPEEDIEIVLAGNLFAQDTTLVIIVPTLGAFTVLTTIQRSSLALVEQTGISGLTVGEAADLNLIKQMLSGNATVSLDDRTVTVFDTNGVTVLATFDISVDGRIRLRTS